jgi:hypothetical protein
MGMIPVDRRVSGRPGEGIAVLDEERNVRTIDADYLESAVTGTLAQGVFHCAECGYGITVHAALPQCPMCAGTTWERAADWTIFGRTEFQA